MMFRDEKDTPKPKRLWLFSIESSDALLLISTDHAALLLHRDFGQGLNGEPTAVKQH